MALTLVTSYFVQQNTTTNTALTTPSFTPSNGEVIVVKLGTWSTTISMGAPTGGAQTYTSRVINAPGSFNAWCGIYTAVISGSPGSMTISSTPSGSARYSMTVERWSGAQLAASPVTASSNGSGAAAGTITPAAGTSIISWVSSDIGSIDPATRAYLGSGFDEGVRDGHLGSNGVEYYAYQAASGTGSQSYGLSLPTGQTFVIAGIEVQDAGGGAAATPQPIVATGPNPAAAGRQVLLRNPAALIAPAALGSAPIVVTASVQPIPAVPVLLRAPAAPAVPTQPYVVAIPAVAAPPATAVLSRGSLTDPPILTTPSPLVVSAPAAARTGQALVFGAPQAPVAPPPATATVPIVVTAPTPTPAAALTILGRTPAQAPASAVPLVVTAPAPFAAPRAIAMRGALVDAPVLTTPSPLVVTASTAIAATAPILARSPQPAQPVVTGPTIAPIVITGQRPFTPGAVVLIRSTGAGSTVVVSGAPRPRIRTTTRIPALATTGYDRTLHTDSRGG